MISDSRSLPKRLTSCAVCILAHNEAERLPKMLDSLARQDVFAVDQLRVRVIVAANGCTDNTVTTAKSQPIAENLGNRFVVMDLEQGGKSNAWNRVVHSPLTNEVDVLVFCDADIAFGSPDTVSRMLASLEQAPEVAVWGSRPVKRTPLKGAGLVERVVNRATGTASNWQKSICGQLYAIRGNCARDIWMPIGLPVEDGFLRAMVLTDCFSKSEDLRLIDGRDDVWHSFEPERELWSLVHHQSRIVTGSAINSVVFSVLDQAVPGEQRALLRDAAEDADWVPRQLADHLPRLTCGWVPWSFLTKRSLRMLGAARTRSGLKRLALLPLFFGFDLLCWVIAQLRLAMGRGAGFW